RDADSSPLVPQTRILRAEDPRMLVLGGRGIRFWVKDGSWQVFLSGAAFLEFGTRRALAINQRLFLVEGFQRDRSLPPAVREKGRRSVGIAKEQLAATIAIPGPIGKPFGGVWGGAPDVYAGAAEVSLDFSGRGML
ncbi:MAG: hypothetical protein ACI4MU_08300, partial [Candidatus Ventricola sp.]